MNPLAPVYTEKIVCTDCYKCIRNCPVKAIKIEADRAVILPERCVGCGNCTMVCPNKAKKIRNDVDKAKLMLRTEKNVYCSIDPTYAAEFHGIEDLVIAALYKLGFAGVSETAIGAALVSEAMDIYASEHEGSFPFISTACPGTVELVKKYYPEQIENLSPLPSPLQTHCAYLRHLYGKDIYIIYIGPCAARKTEVNFLRGFPNIALTFKELRRWLRKEAIYPEDIQDTDKFSLIPSKAGMSSLYAIEGGQIRTSKLWGDDYFSKEATSLTGILPFRDSMPFKKECFLEASVCPGGCINGVGITPSVNPVERKRYVSEFTGSRLGEEDCFKGDPEFARRLLDEGYKLVREKPPARADGFKQTFSEAEITEMLRLLGKENKKDESDCGGCGYYTCRDMAKACLSGMANANMCVTKMRKDAERKANTLLSSMPNSVVIVDRDIIITDCNMEFIKTFADLPEEFTNLIDLDFIDSFKGLPLGSFIDFDDKFEEQFSMEKPGQYRFKHKDRVIKVTFFPVDRNKLLGAIFEDITTTSVKRETVVKKANEVLDSSLKTVQQIAHLLGENAAETEIMLNSLVDAFNVRSDYEGFIEETENI